MGERGSSFGNNSAYPLADSFPKLARIENASCPIQNHLHRKIKRELTRVRFMTGKEGC